MPLYLSLHDLHGLSNLNRTMKSCRDKLKLYSGYRSYSYLKRQSILKKTVPPKRFPFALKTISLWPFSDSLRGFVKLKLQLLSTLLCALCALCGKLIHSLTTPKIFRNEFSFLGKQKKSRNINKQNAVILSLDGVCPRLYKSPYGRYSPPFGIRTMIFAQTEGYFESALERKAIPRAGSLSVPTSPDSA